MWALYERRCKEQPHLRYRPNRAVRPFHTSKAPVRALSGPNRGGKTLAGAFEIICAALGFNPFRPWRQYRLPTLVWAVSLDNKRLGRILRHRIKQFLPPGGYREFIQDGIFVLNKKYGCSEIHMMSCEAGPGRFKGAECDLISFDEEPNPRGEEIFNECYSRFGVEYDEEGQQQDRLLEMILHFTPDQGATWSYGRLYDQTHDDYLRGPKGEKIVDFFEFSLFDCDRENGGHLSHDAIMRQFHAYKPHERKARFYGKYSLVGANTYFDGEQIEAAMERIKTAPGVHARVTINDLRQTKYEVGPFKDWLFFEERIPGEQYMIGVDVSGGLKQDRSVAYVIALGLKMRNEQGQVVNGNLKPRRAARFRSSRIDPERFAREIVYPLAVYFWNALVVPERNGQYGGAFIVALRNLYDNLFNDIEYDKNKQKWKGDIGWSTNDSTRGLIWSFHELALREGWNVYSSTCLAELGTVIEKKSESTRRSRIEAAHGCHDDEVFGLGLAGAAWQMDPPLVMPPIEECCEQYFDDDDPAAAGSRYAQDEEVYA